MTDQKKTTLATHFAARFAKDREGVAAVEFAIGAPMLLFFLVLMTDFGLAINERMNLDQTVRAGAEFAMNEVNDINDLKSLMKGAATGSYHDDQSPAPDTAQWDPPNVEDSRKWCECPDAAGVEVTCGTTICSNNLPASVYYQLVAKKQYDGLVIDLPLQTDIRVQVR